VENINSKTIEYDYVKTTLLVPVQGILGFCCQIWDE